MIKKSIFWLILIAIPLGLLELLAFVLLSLFFKGESTAQLVEQFPAQFVMEADELRAQFPSLSPLQRTGQYLGFEFDPVLGFKDLGAIEEHGNGGSEDEFLIVTLGGSTTVGDNWPSYLIDVANRHNIHERITVVNAGLWGYNTFNEKIYLSSWILPALKEKGRTADLILSLDGVNDIWYRILGYLESQKGEGIWNPNYHGYHHHHDNDMRNIKTLGGATNQLLANLSSSAYLGAVGLFPYTIKLMEVSLKSMNSGGQPQRVEIEQLDLPKEVEERIIDAYEQSLLDLYGITGARDIPYVGYLQPVRNGQYHPFPTPDEHLYDGIDYMGYSIHRIGFTRLGVAASVDTEALYRDAELMYKRLDTDHPGRFGSLIDLFQQNGDTAALYQKDGIHYRELGSELIAERIIRDLLERGLLHIRQPAEVQQ